jgi:hypothetical protein
MAEKQKTFKLEGHALTLARQWSETMDRARAEQEALRKEYQDRMKASGEKATAKLHDIWIHMVALIGLSPDETWQNPEWGLEVAYIEHDAAFILWHEAEENPFAAMMRERSGQPEPAAKSADAPKVDPSKLN